MTARMHLLFSVTSTTVVLVAVVWGVVLVGSPQKAREQRFDQQRLNDLQTMFHEIQSLCRDPEDRNALKRALPDTLDELAALARNRRINLTDPETGQPYDYSVIDATHYELCATFSLVRDVDEKVFWNHPRGRHCFTVDAVDPP